MNPVLVPVQTAEAPSKKVLFFIGFLVCSFAYVILKDAGFSRLLVMGAAAAGGLWYLSKGYLRREFVIYFLVAYLPFSKQIPVDFGGVIPGFNLTNILVGLAGIFWYWERGKEQGGKAVTTPLDLPLRLFLILGVISILRGAVYGPGYLVEASLQYFRTWLIPLFLYFLTVQMVQERKVVKNVTLIIMMVTTVVALMAAYEYLDSDDRVGGVFDQPNQLAAFFNYYMFLPVGFFFLESKPLKKWPLLLPFLICFRGIMVTFSRAGYLAVVVGLYAVTFFRSKRFFLLLLFATWFVAQHPVLLPEGIRYRLAQTLQNQPVQGTEVSVGVGHLDKSSSNRVKVWRGAVWMIRENPLFGVGYYLFESKIRHYYTGTRSYDPHNTYLLIASEMGIPALLVFLWVLWCIFWHAHLLYKSTQDLFVKALALGFLGGFFGLLVSNVYGSRFTYLEVSSYFWILVALMMRLKIPEGEK